MSRLLDVSARNDGVGENGPVAGAQPYVLVADTDRARTDACLASIRPFQIGVLVAHDGEEAMSILRRMGPPALLITDLRLPRPDGFTVIDALRRIDYGRTKIIAWSSSRAEREFAANQFSGQDVRVLGGAVAAAVLARVIEQSLRIPDVVEEHALEGRRADDRPDEGETASALIDAVQRTVVDLSEEARRLCETPGVAVYYKAPGETGFRTSVTWMSERPIPQSQSWLPRVFTSIVDGGEAMVLPDLAARPSAIAPAPDGVRGLVAVPILDVEQQVVGVICAFDVKPLELDQGRLAALEALGRPAKAPSIAPLKFEPADVRAARSDRAQDLRLLLSRSDGDLALSREMVRVRREQRRLSIALFEVDAHPNHEGVDRDRALDRLTDVSTTLCRAVRGSDLAVRWGGLEFLVVFPGLSRPLARRVAERIRAVLEAAARYDLTVAGGVAELAADDQSVQAIVDRATDRLRLAQIRGPNRVA
jgi:diguanylate cyclase (GGDEF)-like protein